jgi:hypothetical protein
VVIERVIIKPHAGGLGDQLMYSWIPERIVRETGAEVMISNDPASRNPETRELIWGLNPFVSGYTDEPANAGCAFEDFIETFIGAAKIWRYGIAAVEARHGLQPRALWPKLYYQPKYRPDARETVFADPFSISQPVPAFTFDQHTYEISRYRGYDIPGIVVLRSKHKGQYGGDALEGNPTYEVRDIFEYCDLIYSCRAFICTESGGQSVAAALRGDGAYPAVHVIVANHTFNDRVWIYDNIDYHVTDMRGDYLPYGDPPEGFGEVKRLDLIRST